MANLLKYLRRADYLASLGFRDGRQKFGFLGSIEFKSLVALMSQYCDRSSVGQDFGVDLNHAVVNSTSGD